MRKTAKYCNICQILLDLFELISIAKTRKKILRNANVFANLDIFRKNTLLLSPDWGASVSRSASTKASTSNCWVSPILHSQVQQTCRLSLDVARPPFLPPAHLVAVLWRQLHPAWLGSACAPTRRMRKKKKLQRPASTFSWGGVTWPSEPLHPPLVTSPQEQRNVRVGTSHTTRHRQLMPWGRRGNRLHCDNTPASQQANSANSRSDVRFISQEIELGISYCSHFWITRLNWKLIADLLNKIKKNLIAINYNAV